MGVDLGQLAQLGDEVVMLSCDLARRPLSIGLAGVTEIPQPYILSDHGLQVAGHPALISVALAVLDDVGLAVGSGYRFGYPI